MDIFSYHSHIRFLCDQFQASPRPTSYRQIAKKLGYKSSRSVGMVLKGKRMPSTSMTLQLASYLKLDELEKRYLELLIQSEQLSRKGKSVELVERELRRINPFRTEKKVLDATYFSFVADWYHFVLKQLVSTPGFQNDFKWIRQVLKNKVSLTEIKTGFHNLSLLGLISECEGRISVKNKNVTTSHDTPSSKIRQHHRQMMTRAAEALEEEDIANREFFSMTFKPLRKDIPKIKEQIRKFKNQIESQYDSVDSDDVFQLNLQFFSHTLEKLQKGKCQ